MKRSVTFLIAVLAVVVAVPSFAGTATGNLTVQASVVKNCLITTTPVTFTGYDPIVANATNDMYSNGSLTVTCTKGSSGVWVGLDTGLHSANATGTTRAMAWTTNYLSYELYTANPNPTPGTAWGNTAATGSNVTFSSGAGLANPATLTVFGRLPAGQDVPATASAATYSYVDTVTATVNY